jgi:subtilase family serine protease
MFRRICGSGSKADGCPGRIEPLEQRQLLSAVANSVLHPDLSLGPERRNRGGNSPAYYIPANGYSPSQIEEAYDFNQINFNGVAGTGAGTTIAIVDAYDDPNIASDLATFDSNFNLAAPPSFAQVSQSGGSTSSLKTNAGWDLETALDVEWAHAIAPDANILLVEAKSDTLSNLMSAVEYASNASGVVSVSMSWGGNEFAKELTYDSYFTTPAGHGGVTFVAASGDNGSWNGSEWPASSPSVVSVGGTSLYTLNSTGTYGLETGWSGSGGGESQYVNEPSYQESAQQTGTRTTPDVAYDADPNTGFAVYDSVPYEGISGWQVIGGTSAGSPQIAALVSIADQGRALKNQPSLDGATQTLPLLYSIYSSYGSAGYSTYASAYHDINAGQTSFFARAQDGYDLVTGLGTPVASQIVTVLTGGTVTLSSPASEALRLLTSKRIFGVFAKAPAPLGATVFAQSDFIAAIAPADATLSAQSGSAATADSSSGASISASILSAEQSAASMVKTAASAMSATLTGMKTDFIAILSQVPAEAAAAPPTVVELARFDAGFFADSLRTFAHEAAMLGVSGTKPGSGWWRPAATSAAALLADAVLVGFWYFGRLRRQEKALPAVADIQPPDVPSSTPTGK